MAISHAGHDHPSTPAARAACRKRMNAGGTPVEAAVLVGKSQGGPKIVVVPRRRGDGGVVKGMQTGDQGVVRAGKAKAYERPINSVGDLPVDFPRHFMPTIKAAADRGWKVVEGLRLNDAETRILIGGDVAQVSLVYNAGGDSGVFVRSTTSSISRRVDSGPQAIALASGDEEWPWMNHGKRV